MTRRHSPGAEGNGRGESTLTRSCNRVRSYATRTQAKRKGDRLAQVRPTMGDGAEEVIQRVDAEALIKRAVGYFQLSETDLSRKRGQHRQERAIVMELLHRYSGLSRG